MNPAVLDASVALKWVLVEPLSDEALAIRDAFLGGHLNLIAPDVFLPEVANALARSHRRGIIPEPISPYGELLAMGLRLFPTPPLVERALEIATSHRIGVYDCIYVALAEREGCDLITADDRLVRNLAPTFPFVVALDSFP